VAKLNLLLLAVLVAAILPVGCASHSVSVPKEVRVSVPVPCVSERPARPQFRSLSELLSMPAYDRTIAAWSELRKHEAYSAELEAVVEGCSRL
jgi:hypothetical protein